MGNEKGLKILIVEDEPDMAETLSMLLKRKVSAQSETALNCSTARDKINSLTFDLITLDYQLPDGDGLSLLQEIVSMEDPPPVVMVTGHGDERTAVEAFKLGASGYVVKDGRIGVMLVEEVKAALLRRDLRRTELELIEKNNMLNHIFESTAAPILIGGPDNRFEYVNPALAGLLGYHSPDELIGTKIADRYEDPVERDKLINLLMKSGSVSNYGLKLRHRDGSIFYAEINAVLYRDEDGNITHTLASASMERQQEEYERVIRINEEKYKQMFDNVSSGLGVLRTIDDGETFIIVDFNRAAERIENLNRAEVIGKAAPEVFPDIVEYGLYDIVKRVYRTGEPERFPASRYSDDRITGWRSGHVFRVPDGEIIIIYDDTTEYIKAAQELERSNDLLEHIYELAPEGIIVTNRDQIIEFANSRAVEIFKVSSLENFIGTRSGCWYVNSGDREKILNLVTDQGFVLDYEVELKHEDGSSFWARLSVAPETDGNGNIFRFITVASDITQQCEAEEQLKSSEARIREVYSSAVEAIVVVGVGGIIEYVNPAFTEMFRYSSSDELVGVSSTELYADPVEIENILSVLEEQGSVRGREVLVRRKDGSVFWILANMTAYKDLSGKMVRAVGFLTDISEQKKAEEEVLKVNEELEAYAQSVSHILKGPLSAIGLAVELIRSNDGNHDNVDTADLLDSIENNANLGHERISDLLELARFGQVPSRIEGLEVRDVVDEILRVMASRLEARGVKMTVDEDLGCIRADRMHVLQIFANLISNAFKHNDSKEPHITVSYCGKGIDGSNCYIIHDNGSGIRSDDFEKIFVPFYKGKESGETGLGLPMARRIARIYGGDIRVFNDDGASFEVTLKDFPSDALR